MYIKDGICYASEMKPSIKVSSIKVLETGMMLVTFTTGETRLFDVIALTKTGPAFSKLSDFENQKTAKVTFGFVSWLDGEIDIAPETMYRESYEYPEDIIA